MRIPESKQFFNYDVFFGIDVDSKSFAFTALDEKGVISKKVPADERNLANYLKNSYEGKKVVVAYEAGPTGYFLYDHLKAHDYPCLVVPPTTMLKNTNERVKNNRIDSVKIADQMKAGQLCSIRVPEGAYRELRHLVSSRENYAGKRREARQRIKSLLLFEHLGPEIRDPDQNWSLSFVAELRRLPCRPVVRIRLDGLLDDHDYARNQLLKTYKQLKAYIQLEPELREYTDYLKSIPGIGSVTAATILGRVGDPTQLKNEREIGCFAGLTPRERSTGDYVNRGHISHFGDSILRSLLVEAAWIAIRRDNELRMFYDRIHQRNHRQFAARKAIVAVARKMTQRIYRVLKDKRPYMIH